MSTTTMEGLVWHSLVYQPANELDGLTGPDTNTRCESPAHKFGEFKPPAEWIEMLWYPKGDKTVARCWKTCEQCHVGMAQSAERTGAQRAAEQCQKCGRTFREDGKFVDSAARHADSPFCKTCADRCHDSEIADHWCAVDQWRKEQQT